MFCNNDNPPTFDSKQHNNRSKLTKLYRICRTCSGLQGKTVHANARANSSPAIRDLRFEMLQTKITFKSFLSSCTARSFWPLPSIYLPLSLALPSRYHKNDSKIETQLNVKVFDPKGIWR